MYQPVAFGAVVGAARIVGGVWSTATFARPVPALPAMSLQVPSAPTLPPCSRWYRRTIGGIEPRAAAVVQPVPQHVDVGVGPTGRLGNRLQGRLGLRGQGVDVDRRTCDSGFGVACHIATGREQRVRA